MNTSARMSPPLANTITFRANFARLSSVSSMRSASANDSPAGGLPAGLPDLPFCQAIDLYCFAIARLCYPSQVPSARSNASSKENAISRWILFGDFSQVLKNRSMLRHAMLLSSENLRLDDEEAETGEVTDFRAAGGAPIVKTGGAGHPDLGGRRSLPADIGTDGRAHAAAT